MLSAILIDPYTQTIEEVEYSGDYRDISALLDCELFTTVYTDLRDTIYIDDEGLYVENQRYFKVKGYPQPLAGKGLVLGTDYGTGDSIDCVSSLDDILRAVEFCPEGTTVEPVMAVYPMEDDINLDELSDKDLIELIFGERTLH